MLRRLSRVHLSHSHSRPRSPLCTVHVGGGVSTVVPHHTQLVTRASLSAARPGHLRCPNGHILRLVPYAGRCAAEPRRNSGGVEGGPETWRGRGVVVLTPRGRLTVAHAARLHDAVAAREIGVLVVDLVQADGSDTDAVASLLRTLAGARRAGWTVVVANPTPDVEIALRPLSIVTVDTTDGAPVDLPEQRDRW